MHLCVFLTFDSGILSNSLVLLTLFYSVFRKYSHLDFFHILLCYSLNLKCIQLRFCVTGLHTIPQNVKVELCFSKCLQINTNLHCKVLSQYVFNPFVMASLNKFRSKNVLNKSHKSHGLTLCAIIVFNIPVPHICVPHTYNYL